MSGIPTFSSFSASALPAKRTSLPEDESERRGEHKRHRSRREEDDSKSRRDEEHRHRSSHRHKHDEVSSSRSRTKHKRESREEQLDDEELKRIEDRRARERREREANRSDLHHHAARNGKGRETRNSSSDEGLSRREETSFVIDKVGDENAARYGGHERVPKYRRFGEGRVLGVPTELRITYDSARKGKGVEITVSGRKAIRYLERSSQSVQTKLLRARSKHPHDQGDEPAADFIQVRRITVAEDGAAPDYRSIYPLRSGSRDSDMESDDSESGLAEQKDAGISSTHSDIHKRSRDLDARVRSHPTDIAAWLDLTEFQEDFIRADQKDEARKGLPTSSSRAQRQRVAASALRRTIAEAQLAVLNRAMAATPTNVHSKGLRLARVRIAAQSEMWTAQEADVYWRTLMRDTEILARTDPGASLDVLEVWQAFLIWRRGSSYEAEVHKVVDDFASAVTILATLCKRLPKNSEGRSILENAIVSIVLDAALLLKHAGFVERSIAILQGIAEVTFCRASTLSEPSVSDEAHDSIEVALSNFEQFWNSEQPRIGEKGALGWHATSTVESSDQDQTAGSPIASEHTLQLVNDSAVADTEEARAIEYWLHLERLRSSFRSMPARTTDTPRWRAGEVEVDADSIVVFSDIKPFLIRLSVSSAKEALLEALLCVLDLSVVSPGRVLLRPSECLTRSEVRKSLLPAWLTDTSATFSEITATMDDGLVHSETRSGLADPYRCPIKCWPALVEEMLPWSKGAPRAKAWFSLLGNGNVAAAETEQAKTFVRQILRQNGSSQLRNLALCLEASSGQKNTSKLARELLAEHGSDLNLWRTYALLEGCFGKLTSARRVLQSTLESVSSLPHLQQHEAPPLWATWVGLEMEAGQERRALALLDYAASVHFSGIADKVKLENLLAMKDALGTSELLRSRRVYRTEVIQRALGEESRGRNTPYLVDCAARFEYLTLRPSEGFTAALDVYNTFRNAVLASQVQQELLPALEQTLMRGAKFLWHWLAAEDRRAYRPMDVRHFLTAALELFPRNTMFLSLLGAHEMKSKIANHLRNSLEKSVLPTGGDRLHLRQGPYLATGQEGERIAWLWAIYAELHMYQHRCNETLVRALFERAVEHESASTSAVVWQLFLDFEVCIAKRALAHLQNEQIAARKERSSTTNSGTAKLFEVAKGVLYRSVQACPYRKELYLAAFSSPFRFAFNLSELRSLARGMEDRDLRIFASLEDILEDRLEHLDAESASGDGSENDEEAEKIWAPEPKVDRRLLPHGT